jgi:hypothetical protein
MCFWVVFPGQKWSDLCWLGTFIDEPNEWKRGFSEETHPEKQNNDYMWSYWYVGNFTWVSSEDFEGQPEYALNCHQIHAIHLVTLHILWLKTNYCNFTPSPLTRFSNVTSFLSQNSRWHFNKGDLMISPWHKQNHGTCLLSFKQFT